MRIRVMGTAPVGEETDPGSNPDPPLTHRVPEGGVNRSPVPGKYHARLLRGNRASAHACNTELTSNCV